MFQKKRYLVACLFYTIISSAVAQKIHFADRALLGSHVGYTREYDSSLHDRFEESWYFGPRAGVSINNWLYGGIQARLIRARNFETPWQRFYMAGVWGRGYLLRPQLTGKSSRWGIFLESGLMTGNYSFDDRNSVLYYVQRKGQWYIPFIAGIEYRFLKQLSLEACFQGYSTIGKSWDQYGIAYFSLGLNWYLKK